MPLPARRLEITRWSFGKTLRQICFVPAQAGPARSRAFRYLSGQIAWILPAASVRAEAWRLSRSAETAVYRLTPALFPEIYFCRNSKRLTE